MSCGTHTAGRSDCRDYLERQIEEWRNIMILIQGSIAWNPRRSIEQQEEEDCMRNEIGAHKRMDALILLRVAS